MTIRKRLLWAIFPAALIIIFTPVSGQLSAAEQDLPRQHTWMRWDKDYWPTEPVRSRKLSQLLLGPIAARGLWVVPAGRYGNVIRFMPPLTIAYDHFVKSVETIIDVLNENKDDLSQ